MTAYLSANAYRVRQTSDPLEEELESHLLIDNASFVSSTLPDRPSERRSPSLLIPRARDDAPFDWRSPIFPKLLLVLAVLIPIPISLYLFYQEVKGIRYSGQIVNMVSQNRTTTQIMVSVVAKILAGINIYAITTLIMFASRIQLTRRASGLNNLACTASITSQSVSWALPGGLLVCAITVLLLFAVPNVLWTGVLTPVFTREEKYLASGLHVPSYTNRSSTVWSNNPRLWEFQCTTNVTSRGIFGDCPATALQTTLLNVASQATANFAGTYDNPSTTGYTYVGRSYGVGSSVGLVDAPLNETGSFLLGYSYAETGYTTEIICARNETSDWHLQIIRDGVIDNGIPNIYYVSGMFPNTAAGDAPDFFAVPALIDSDSLAVVGAKASEGRHIVQLAAGKYYEVLNNTQCEIVYTPTRFNISVDAVSKLIYVVPTNATSIEYDEEGGLAATATKQVNAMGMINTSLYVSIVGEALMYNIRAANGTLSAYAALGDSFVAILDALLLFVGASQLIYSEDSEPVDMVTIEVRAVKLGDKIYTGTILAICLALFLALITEIFRTRFWRDLPRFDFADLRSTMIASATAGEQLLERAWPDDASSWAGGTEMLENPRLGKTDVRLRLGRRQVMVRGSRRRALAWWPEFSAGFTPLAGK